jgi:hypothetical protein
MKKIYYVMIVASFLITTSCFMPMGKTGDAELESAMAGSKVLVNTLFPSGSSYAGQGQIIVTYADLDNDPATGVDVGGTWYPNETQIALFAIEGYVQVDPPGFPDYIYFTPGADDTGIFAIQFIDVMAAGWVWNDPNTWTERYVNEVYFDVSTDYTPYNPNPYIATYAYRNFFQDTLVDSKQGAGTGSFVSANGFSELIFRTDFAENNVESLDVYVTAAQNTPTGTDVSVTEGDVTVTFENVTAPGDTEVTQSTTGTPPPPNVYMCDPPVYYNIETTATFEGTVEICVQYDDTVCSEDDLNLYHLVTLCDLSGCEDVWMPVTTSVDTTANIICGEVTSLSEFLLASAAPPVVPQPDLCTDQYQWGDPDYQWEGWIFRSWTRMHLTNLGEGAAYNVTATLSSWPVNVTVWDGTVEFGDIAAGGDAWSLDTFEITVDMSNPQDPEQGVTWTLEYDDASGEHYVVPDVPEFSCP